MFHDDFHASTKAEPICDLHEEGDKQMMTIIEWSLGELNINQIISINCILQI